MERIPVVSSDAVSIGYDENQLVLEVEFKNSIYQYLNVPPHIFTDLMNASSIGTYLHQNVKKIYPYIKVG